PPGSADRILHARLVIDGHALMASDSMVGHPYEGMKGFSLSLGYPTVAEAKKVFNALSDGGKITMPIEKTFWAEAFGMLVDRFGTAWMISGPGVKRLAGETHQSRRKNMYVDGFVIPVPKKNLPAYRR